MPKGALLHAHLDAMVDFDYLFNLLLETEGLHLACISGSLATQQGRQEAGIAIKFRKRRPPPKGLYEEQYHESIWTDTTGALYKTGEYIPLVEAAELFPDGGTKGFVEWLKGRVTLTMTDGLEQHHGIAAIWDKFEKCFGILNNVLHYEPIWRAFLRRLMEQSVEDGVYWIEIRYVVFLSSPPLHHSLMQFLVVDLFAWEVPVWYFALCMSSSVFSFKFPISPC